MSAAAPVACPRWCAGGHGDVAPDGVVPSGDTVLHLSRNLTDVEGLTVRLGALQVHSDDAAGPGPAVFVDGAAEVGHVQQVRDLARAVDGAAAALVGAQLEWALEQVADRITLADPEAAVLVLLEPGAPGGAPASRVVRVVLSVAVRPLPPVATAWVVAVDPGADDRARARFTRQLVADVLGPWAARNVGARFIGIGPGRWALTFRRAQWAPR